MNQRIFALAAIVLVGSLMWGLQVLASMVGSSTEAAKAVDADSQSITIAIRDGEDVDPTGEDVVA